MGASDGAVSIAGVIAGGAAHIPHPLLARAAIGGALAATVSMAGGEMLSQDTTDWGAAGTMGLGTLLGSALPALPLFLLSSAAAWFVVASVATMIGLAVGFVRARTTHRRLRIAISQTTLVLVLGACVGFGAGLL